MSPALHELTDRGTDRGTQQGMDNATRSGDQRTTAHGDAVADETATGSAGAAAPRTIGRALTERLQLAAPDRHEPAYTMPVPTVGAAAFNAPTVGGSAIERYYRLHAGIYDATRWSFLFGRDRILAEVAQVAQPRRILEVGCGTGRNLAALARRFPAAEITGVDLSDAMLAKAAVTTARFGDRVQLLRRSYDAPLRQPSTEGASVPTSYDLVLFSYALSMFNPGYEAAIDAALADLAPGGYIAVVDFHATDTPAFARWMRVNHVRMDAQLRPLLRERFGTSVDRLVPAYRGLWHYLLFLGQRPPLTPR